MIHPHFHVLLAVEPVYFNTKRNKYIKQEEFRKMWQKALRVDYLPEVNVKIIKPKKNTSNPIASAVAETVKYPMKDTDIIRLSNKQFQELVKQLKGIRNINAGGILKGILKGVKKLDDDLVHIDEDEKSELWIIIEKLLYIFESQNEKLDYYRKAL